jgi:hypothetical protein
MKQLLIILLLPLSSSLAFAQQPAAEVSFTFTRQSGRASNQYAVWVQTAEGQYVATLNATRWTARGGWQRRPTSLPVWVSQSDISEKTRVQIDAVSSATGRTGSRTYVWNGTDNNGNPVPPGNFVIYVEGTLRWENQVMFRAPIVLGQGAQPAAVSTTFQGDSTAERGMLSGVTVRALR